MAVGASAPAALVYPLCTISIALIRPGLGAPAITPARGSVQSRVTTVSALKSSNPKLDWASGDIQPLEWRSGMSPWAHPRLPPGGRHGRPDNITHILVAEDDIFHRRILRLLLASPSISLMEVENGAAAVELLSLRPFDLLLLDTDMPRMDGPETLRWIRRSNIEWANLPVLGLVDEFDANKAKKMQAYDMNDWTHKPVSRADLVAKIRYLAPGLYNAAI